MRSVIFLFVFILSVNLVSGQNSIGLPEVVNYTKQHYKGGTQNWAIRQDKNGIMYFANNEGLLTFDGIYWRLYPLTNKTKIRSLEIGTDNRIYIGAENEFGYFSPDDSGTLVYVSLKKLVQKKDEGFADVWNVVELDGKIFFRASNRIFLYENNTITTYNPNSTWRYMGVNGKLLIAQDASSGLLKFNNGRWEVLPGQNLLPADYLGTAIIPYGKNTSLLVTLDHGVYILGEDKVAKLESAFISKITKERIYTATRVSDDLIALCTQQGGCYTINNKGDFVYRFNKADGLQNNNVLSVFRDKDRNLWLGLDSGIDFIANSNAIKNVYPAMSKEGGGYASAIFENRLYIGTSIGLFYAEVGKFDDLSLVKGDFSFVQNSNGQVWGLSEINGKLLMAHHDGIFQIEGGVAKPIVKRNGFWGFLPLSRIFPVSHVAVGTYNGIDFLKYENGSFRQSGHVANFDIAARFLCTDARDEHVIWTSHPYRGVFKITTDGKEKGTSQLYSAKDGLPLSLNNKFIYKIKNKVLVTTENGIYEYDEQSDRFRESVFYKNIFKGIWVSHLKEDQAGNIWFVRDKQLGVVDMTGTKPRITYIPELNHKLVSGFEYIHPIDKNNILVGAERGFYHINFEKYKQNKNNLEVRIRTVRAIGNSDSLLFGGYFGEVNEVKKQSDKQELRIDYGLNSLRFEFSSALYSQQSNIEYAYFLQGFDHSWSGWSGKGEKEYTNLPAGTYVFQVKARNNFGNESAVSAYHLIVLPPWYQSMWAYMVYGLMLLALGYVYYLWQEKRFAAQQQKYQQEQKRLQYLHQLEIEKSEKEIIKLNNEKLEAEITHKNTDLATSAMHLVQKSELLSKLKTDLTRILKNSEDEQVSEEVKKMIKVVSEENKVDKDWGQFSKHFDSVHSNFLISLKEKYPNLTATELKMSAYLRMNLSSKEIAQLMNISLRGVEVSRYRLRKKLQLPTEINMFNYFLGFHVDESKDKSPDQ